MDEVLADNVADRDEVHTVLDVGSQSLSTQLVPRRTGRRSNP